MKKICIYFLTTLLLMASIESIAQSDFTVTCNSPYIGGGYIKPMKAGSSIQFQVKLTNNKNVTYTVSIN